MLSIPKAYRFYVVEHNDFISVNIVIESRNAIFDETRFSSIPKPKEIIPSTSGTHKETESSEMTPDEPMELRKNMRKRKSKSFGPDFQLYLIEGSRDEQQVDLIKEFLSSRFSMEDMRETDVIFVSTLMDPSVKLMHNTGEAAFQLEYSNVIDCLMYAMTSTRPDIAYAVGKLKDHSSTSGWVFLLGRGVISWASKKQTCKENLTMESEIVALATAGKAAEWLRNLIHEIPLWPKPISLISIHCDSTATLAKVFKWVEGFNS
ncbi:UNVERIFIED_CONTAM: hypothetical protein Scaly_2427500 [Sesamum calycinum]|uniref:Zinc finger, CCHC-type n=1 Tax=Sesamum calycinum TaxID=2727403 RepID=A0AAW2LZE5_9LAMI